ncbi:MAG: hypothetical protein IPM26_05405 [Saprospiraceae bacterium]|nr:hypothetical protein [Saprospiraceae bacterium]
MKSALSLLEKRFDTKIIPSLLTDVYNYLGSTSSNRAYSDKAFIDKSTEAKLLEEYIEENNLFYNNLDFSVYLDEGAEQKVFHDEASGRVIKFNDGIFYVNWTQYFESLIVHNVLFKETSYDLLGFIRINHSIFAVVSQIFITPTEKTNIELVRNFMKQKGFTLKKNNDYVHTHLGLILEDLHEENVLICDGTLFFIDTVIYVI